MKLYPGKDIETLQFRDGPMLYDVQYQYWPDTGEGKIELRTGRIMLHGHDVSGKLPPVLQTRIQAACLRDATDPDRWTRKTVA